MYHATSVTQCHASCEFRGKLAGKDSTGRVRARGASIDLCCVDLIWLPVRALSPSSARRRCHRRCTPSDHRSSAGTRTPNVPDMCPHPQCP